LQYDNFCSLFLASKPGKKAMSYAAVMVYFDASAQAQARLRLAAGLADRFQAALIGVAGLPNLPPYSANATDALAAIERKFRDAAKPCKDVEWRGGPVWASILIAQEARAADLVVVGPVPDARDLSNAHHPGAIILAAGRPVLFVPDGVDSLAARRVVVAWKDSRESRRAIRDALPFLREAERITIVEVSEQAAPGRTSIDDVADYLKRHKVVVTTKTYLTTKKSVADEILRFTREENADLVVAGGYGRTLLGEWIFGGVTRDLIAHAPVCCLFSH
jgi:nucleotide-binding universal stress UspA family protein